jgi:hypothetical protein
MYGAAYVFTWVLGLYFAAGVLFGLAFITLGVDRIDAAARDTGPGFRFMILPGSIALWPVLLKRWLV